VRSLPFVKERNSAAQFTHSFVDSSCLIVRKPKQTVISQNLIAECAYDIGTGAVGSRDATSEFSTLSE
jgi:hypothetical protein